MLSALFKRYLFHRAAAEQQTLDRALELWRVETPNPGLAERILAQAASMPQMTGARAQLPAGMALREPGGIPIWPSPLLWPGAAAFALAVLLGYVAALHGLGFASDESLNMADAAALQEDFGDL